MYYYLIELVYICAGLLTISTTITGLFSCVWVVARLLPSIALVYTMLISPDVEDSVSDNLLDS